MQASTHGWTKLCAATCCGEPRAPLDDEDLRDRRCHGARLIKVCLRAPGNLGLQQRVKLGLQHGEPGGQRRVGGVGCEWGWGMRGSRARLRETLERCIPVLCLLFPVGSDAGGEARATPSTLANRRGKLLCLPLDVARCLKPWGRRPGGGRAAAQEGNPRMKAERSQGGCPPASRSSGAPPASRARYCAASRRWHGVWQQCSGTWRCQVCKHHHQMTGSSSPG